MIDVKIKRMSFMLTSAPCSTKNLTISIDFALIATLRGHLFNLKEFQKNLVDIKIERAL